MIEKIYFKYHGVSLYPYPKCYVNTRSFWGQIKVKYIGTSSTLTYYYCVCQTHILFINFLVESRLQQHLPNQNLTKT